MKSLLPIICCVLSFLSLSAQSKVVIQLNHLLDGEVFEMNKASVNDIGNDFMIDRCEYYLSSFSITHDGGQVIEIADKYELIDLKGGNPFTMIDLGEHDISSLESVQFYFGIEEDVNHGDPAAWPSTHPLAPKFPSMHWGWAAGYRFIALEGLSGPTLNQQMEFHCIGDEFYKQLTFAADMSATDNMTVEIDAEYKNMLSSIDISGGVIIHGGFGDMSLLTKNINQTVFKSKVSTSTTDDKLVNEFTIFPNPSAAGIINLNIDIALDDIQYEVSDMTGRRIMSGQQTSQITINQSGTYIVTLTRSNGTILASRKVVIQ